MLKSRVKDNWLKRFLTSILILWKSDVNRAVAHDRNFPILLKTFHLLIYALYNSTKIYNCLNSIYHSSLISPLSLEVCPYLHASFTSLFRPGIILESILFAAEEKIDKLQNDLQKMVEHLQTFMEVKDQHKSQVRSNLCFDLQTFKKKSVFIVFLYLLFILLLFFSFYVALLFI